MADAALLEIRSVHKRFGTVHAVRGVSESIAAGEYYCVLGPSGCGKTTLLRMIAGFDQPTDGDILLDGRSLARTPPERRDVNVVFQSYALFPHLTVFENVAFGLRMKRRAAAEIRPAVDAALRRVQLEGEANRLPRQLSGGQQQRVALARALVVRPRVLLLDEPLSALDTALRTAMQEELRTLQREMGIAFLHITHDQSEALTLADRVAVMRGGRFVQVGTPRDVYTRPATRFVAEFLGASNVLTADASSEGTLVLRGGSTLALSSPHPVGTVELSLRPEALRLASAGSTVDGGQTIPGRLVHPIFTGPAVEWLVDTPAGALRVRAASDDPWNAGDAVAVIVPPRAVVLLRPDEP